MKTLKYINTFAVSLPLIILLSYPFIEEYAFMYSLLSTMVTGFLQVLVALKILYDGVCDRKMYFYLAGVTLFFILSNNYGPDYNPALTFFTFSLPPLLAFYLSFLVYTIKKI